jgi:hypothetical protein
MVKATEGYSICRSVGVGISGGGVVGGGIHGGRSRRLGSKSGRRSGGLVARRVATTAKEFTVHRD